MKVKVYCINKGQPSQYFGLKTIEGPILYSAPNNWKTERGAIRWAVNHGHEIVPNKSITPQRHKITEKKTMYASGVVKDNQTWLETKEGNLTAFLVIKDLRLFASKKAAAHNAEVIASRFARRDKVKPVVSTYRIEV